MSGSAFLCLPAEIRATILDLVVPVRRLCTRELRDEEFKRVTPEGRQIPPILYTCKRLYQDASQVFYAKAILEVAPPQPVWFMFSTLSDDPGCALDPSPMLDADLGFAPKRLLAVVRRVHIFSDQRTAVGAEAYESTLRWLMINTNVRYIHLSKRVQCRLRQGRVAMLPHTRLLAIDPIPLQAIQVFTASGRNKWERVQRRQVENTLGTALPWYHLSFVVRTDDEILLQTDPRWGAKGTDPEEYRQQIRHIGAFLDQLLEQLPHQEAEEVCYRTCAGGPTPAQLQAASLGGCDQDEIPPQAKLYQVIFVLRHK